MAHQSAETRAMPVRDERSTARAESAFLARAKDLCRIQAIGIAAEFSGEVLSVMDWQLGVHAESNLDKCPRDFALYSPSRRPCSSKPARVPAIGQENGELGERGHAATVRCPASTARSGTKHVIR